DERDRARPRGVTDERLLLVGRAGDVAGEADAHARVVARARLEPLDHALDVGEQAIAVRVAERRRRDDAQTREVAVGRLEVPGRERVLTPRALVPTIEMLRETERLLRRLGWRAPGARRVVEILDDAALPRDFAIELLVRAAEIVEARVE